MRTALTTTLACVLLLPLGRAEAQTPRQPKVNPGPKEPDWVDLLKNRYGLSMFGDLANPVVTTVEATPGRFKKAGPGPVKYTPIIALGLETKTHGGWYRVDASGKPQPIELWSYQIKNTTEDLAANKNLPPALLAKSSVAFDPGDSSFGIWVSNEGLPGNVYSEPKVVAAVNPRLAKQPYKAMIYPNRDKATGKLIPHSYLVGWEYSTNDDFQDVVCQVDNVELVKETDTGTAK